jgi:hypothetical protein
MEPVYENGWPQSRTQGKREGGMREKRGKKEREF